MAIRRTSFAKDVPIHVFTEELHHRDEIIAMLWQMDTRHRKWLGYP
jgi:uncharacterized damage-inducible protein DinB